MADNNEIKIDIEDTPRFTLDDELGNGRRIFTYRHSPQYALLATADPTILIPGLAFAAFNKSSMDMLKMVREGDTIQVSADPMNEIYQAWNPPDEYKVWKGYEQSFRVKIQKDDAMGFPMLVGEPVL